METKSKPATGGTGNSEAACLTEPDLIQAIWEKLNCLVDPSLLLTEVKESINRLQENFNEMKKEMETVKKEVELLKQNRLKQFMWMKENLTKLELENETLRDDMENKTNTLKRSIWMTEGTLRDLLGKGDVANIPGITGMGHEQDSSSYPPLDAVLVNSLSDLVSATITAINTPRSNSSDLDANCDDSTLSSTDTIPDASEGNTSAPGFEDEPTAKWPKEEHPVSWRLTTAIMSINSRMHDLERSQVQWKQTYGIQVNGLRAQMQQVQQDSVDMNLLYDEVIRLKKMYEDPEEKGLETKFMHICADLVSKLNGRVENLEKSLEKEKSSDFQSFARLACEGLSNISRNQNTANDLIRRTQQIVDERKAKRAIRAMRAKEDMEVKQAMKIAQMAMGNIRSNVQTDVASSSVITWSTPPSIGDTTLTTGSFSCKK
ncbi:hypothetical protein BDZ91DRAFT_710580 [Kalaharituber pfeilii]|nr:hypothetical protein BDZ91DRAFT_710580 [Kalaharituber pfeilii]